MNSFYLTILISQQFYFDMVDCRNTKRELFSSNLSRSLTWNPLDSENSILRNWLLIRVFRCFAFDRNQDFHFELKMSKCHRYNAKFGCFINIPLILEMLNIEQLNILYMHSLSWSRCIVFSCFSRAHFGFKILIWKVCHF